MTTQDQSIASKVVLFNPYTGKARHPSDIQSDPQGIMIVEPGAPVKAYQPPAPDCRTCENRQVWAGSLVCLLDGACTNGNKYVEAPKAVLWSL